MHHKRDWSKYSKTLVNRGNINLWLTPQVLENWAAKKEEKNGHPFIYGDELIIAMCFIRFKFHHRGCATTPKTTDVSLGRLAIAWVILR